MQPIRRCALSAGASVIGACPDLRLVNGAKSMLKAQRPVPGVAAVAFPGRTADKRHVQKFQSRGCRTFSHRRMI